MHVRSLVQNDGWCIIYKLYGYSKDLLFGAKKNFLSVVMFEDTVIYNSEKRVGYAIYSP